VIVFFQSYSPSQHLAVASLLLHTSLLHNNITRRYRATEKSCFTYVPKENSFVSHKTITFSDRTRDFNYTIYNIHRTHKIKKSFTETIKPLYTCTVRTGMTWKGTYCFYWRWQSSALGHISRRSGTKTIHSKRHMKKMPKNSQLP